MTTPKRLSYYIDNAGPDGKAIRLACLFRCPRVGSCQEPTKHL